EIQSLAVDCPVKSDIQGLQSLLTVQHNLQPFRLAIFVVSIQHTLDKILGKRAVLDIVIGLPKQGNSYRVAAHNGVEQSQDILFWPHEISLNCGENDFFILDLVKQANDCVHLRVLL